MQCIDAIEGTVKAILERFHCLGDEYGLDDTERIRNIKAALEAVDRFLAENQEAVPDPALLKTILYDHAKALWLNGRKVDAAPDEEPAQDGRDYGEYYFDYIYRHDMYPR